MRSSYVNKCHKRQTCVVVGFPAPLQFGARDLGFLSWAAVWEPTHGLASALTDHYGSSGRLADYQRQFEKTVHQDGEEPSIFAIELETSRLEFSGIWARALGFG